jgi:hypothetical protein
MQNVVLLSVITLNVAAPCWRRMPNLGQNKRVEITVIVGDGARPGATTLILMTLSIITLSIMILSIMTLSLMTLSIMTLSIMTLSKMTLSIMILGIMTLSIMTLSNDTQ